MKLVLRTACGLLLIALSGAAQAQEPYPSRTVRIIVPSTAGALTDILARLIGQSLQIAWGQPVIVENRPGADEMIGTDAVAKSPPDGYMLLVVSNAAITAQPHMHAQMRYDPLKDLTALLALGQATPVMSVPASLGVNSVQELIALAKAKPGELNYGSYGRGGYVHVAMEDFKRRTGTDITHVVYRGATPAVTAILRSEIAVLIGNLATIAPHAEAGTVRMIASAGPKRAAMRPDLPTVAESGVPGFSTGAWWGLFGPAGLPAPIVERIRANVGRAIGTPEARRHFENGTIEPMSLTPAELAQFIRDDLDNWGRLIRQAGIKPE